MSTIGDYNFSASSLQSKQVLPPVHSDRPEVASIEKQTSLAGTRSLLMMKNDAAQVKEDVDVVFHPNTSSAEAGCRHLSQITKQYIASHDVFHLDSVKTEGAQQSEIKSNNLDAKKGLSLEELPKTLSAVAAKVQSGEENSQGGAVVLRFGKHQLGLVDEWGGKVEGAVKDIEKQLVNAGPGEKALLQSRLSAAKSLLSDIQVKSSTLRKEVGHLENSLTEKYGKDAVNVAMPAVQHNPSTAYRLTRLR